MAAISLYVMQLIVQSLALLAHSASYASPASLRLVRKERMEAPASIQDLATSLFGKQQGDQILSSSATTSFVVNGKEIVLHVYGKDDSIQRLPGEFQQDVYGISKIQFSSGGIAVDVGANVGTFSISAFKSNPNMKIIALEPMPITYLFLRWNLESNGIPFLTEEQFNSPNCPAGVLALHGAATADGRAVQIEYDPKVSENGITSASGESGMPSDYDIKASHSQDQFIRAVVTSVDITQFLKDHGIRELDVMKMDCEGCEHEVAPTLERGELRIKNFAAEVHPCLNGHSCFYSSDKVSTTRNIFCKKFGCCTPEGASGSETCSSALVQDKHWRIATIKDNGDAEAN